MPPAFAHFRRLHADVTLTVVDDHLQRLIPRVEAGELDLALIYDHEALPEIAARDLERMPLLDDIFRAVLPRDIVSPAGVAARARRSRRRAVDRRSADERLVSNRRPRLPSLQASARTSGSPPTTPIAVQALVAAGLAVSVIPGLAVAHPLPGSRCERSDRTAHPSISAARPRDGYHGRAVTAMIDSLRHAVAVSRG